MTIRYSVRRPEGSIYWLTTRSLNEQKEVVIGDVKVGIFKKRVFVDEQGGVFTSD